MSKTRIKICGITRYEDAKVAVAAGADALGFVFYPGSLRYVTPDKAAAIAVDMPPFLSHVGLFVNSSLADVLHIVGLGFLNVIQLHGDETPEFCRDLLQQTDRPLQVIKAVRLATKEDLQKTLQYCATQDNGLAGQQRAVVQALLLDAKVENQYGGTGQQFDWSLLKMWHSTTPLILAGGLHSDNVAMAIHLVRPYAVDVSSGVETEPGCKSAERINRFIQQVQQADMQS